MTQEFPSLYQIETQLRVALEAPLPGPNAHLPLAPRPRRGALVHDSKLTDSDPNPEATHRPRRYDSDRPSSVI